MNNFKIYSYNNTSKAWELINGTVFPLGIGNFLDKRLDEAYITFYNDVSHYESTAIFKIVSYESGTETKTLYYTVDSDTPVETPVGSGKYKHQIHLLEPTKLTEGILCQSLAFTNDLGEVYTKYQAFAFPTSIETFSHEVKYNAPILYELYKAVQRNNSNLTLLSAKKISENISISKIDNLDAIGMSGKSGSLTIEIGGNETQYGFDEVPTIEIMDTCIFTYYVTFTGYYTSELTASCVMEIKYTVYGVENHLPLKPYTITDMTCRCLELAEPLFATDSATRFVFDGVSYPNGITGAKQISEGSQAEKYDKVFAPEITLTQATLREQLKGIAQLVHAEPRVYVEEVSSSGGVELLYKVKYDEYGIAKEAAGLRGKKYVHKAFSQSINEYCTSVRSNVANLVNALDYGQGVIEDPMRQGNDSFRTVRTDNANVRIGSGNAVAMTAFPIYSIRSVSCGIMKLDGDTTNGWKLNPINITPYVLEKAKYNLLNSYNGGYPSSKNCAVYYTQGGKNIDGLLYKANDTSTSDTFLQNNYAIVNILARAGGYKPTTIANWIAEEGEVALAFRISYVPIYSAMMSHSKQKYEPHKFPYSQIYNQSENLVETHYYGENLKGVAMRLGNVEQERTYILDSINDLPALGQMLDGYAIAAVNAEFMPYHTKCTVALSKDFNRINQYVGISSNKRVFEVSEKEAYERSVFIKENIVVSSTITTSAENTILKSIAPIVRQLTSKPVDNQNMTVVYSTRYSKSDMSTPVGTPTLLPVVSSSFGNAMLFSWRYKDNYSAGVKSDYDSSGSASGYWATDVPYADYYGRIFGYGFILGETANISQPGFPLTAPQLPANSTAKIPLGPIATDGIGPYIMRKDSREVISFNLEFEFQTTDDDIIIGSALAANCPYVTTTPRQAYLFLLKEPVNKFASTIWDYSDRQRGGNFTVNYSTSSPGAEITFPNRTGLNKSYTYWAVAYEPYLETVTFEDEDGKEDGAVQYKGGEILFASTKPIESAVGEPIRAPLYVTVQN